MDATATGSDEIGRAIQKVGGTAGALNVEFEKVSSWIAEISSRTRESSETIGTSIAAMMARFQSIKETGYNEEDATNINDVTRALKAAGIQATDSSGQLINFGNMMDQLGAKFGSLDRKTQAYVATTLAGTRQQSRFLNLMSGYADSVKLYENSLNSAGTTTEKYNLYLQSTEAHLDRLKSIGTGVFMDLFNSEQIRGIIDFLGGMVSAIGTVSSKIGALPTIVGTVTASISLLKKEWSAIQVSTDLSKGGFFGGMSATGWGANIFKNVIADIKSFSTEWDKLNQASMYTNGTFSQMPSVITRLSNGFVALTNSTIAQTAATIGLQAANLLLNAAIGMGIGFLISTAIAAITKWINRAQEAKKATEELTQTVQNSIKQNNSNIETLKSLSAEYDTLSNKTTLTKDESEKLLNIKKQIGDIFPELITGYNKETGEIELQSQSIDELIDKLNEKNRIENLKMVVGGNDAYTAYAKGMKDAEKELDNVNKKIKENDDQIKYWQERLKIVTPNNVPMVQGYIDTYINKSKELAKQAELATDKIKEQTDTLRPFVEAVLETDDSFTKLSESNQKFLKNYVATTDAFKGKSWTEVTAQIENLITMLNNPQMSGFESQIDDINNQFKAGKIGEGEYEEEINKIIAAIAKLTNIDPTIISQFFKVDTTAIEKAINDTDTLQQSLADLEKQQQTLSDSFDKVTTKIQDYNKYLDEASSKKGLSADSVQTIIDKYSELIPYLNNEQALRAKLRELIAQDESAQQDYYNQKLELSRQAMTQEERDAVDAANAKLLVDKDYYSKNILTNKTLIEQYRKLYGVDLNSYKDLASAKQAVEKVLMTRLANAWNKYNQAVTAVLAKHASLAAQMSGNDATASDAATMRLQKLINSSRAAQSALKEVRNVQSAVSGLNASFSNIGLNFGSINLSGIDTGKNTGKTSSSDKAKSAADIYNEEKDAVEQVQKDIIDIIKKRYEQEADMAEKAHNDRLKEYDDDLKKYQDYINGKLKALDDEQAQEDYTKNLKKQQDQALEIQKQIDELSLDTSDEARAKIQDLQNQLADMNSQISDTQENRAKDLEKENLNQNLSGYEADIQKQKDAEDASYDAWKEDFDKRSSDASVNLEAQQALMSGKMLNVEGNLVSLQNAFADFQERFGEGLGILGKQIQSDFIDKLNEANKIIKSLGGLPVPSGSVPGYAEGTANASGGWSIVGENGAELMNLPKGTEIIDHNDTMQFFNIFKNPIQYLPKFTMPSYPQLSGAGAGGVNFSFDNMINVEGNVDKNVVQDLETLTDNVAGRLKTMLNFRGK